MNFKLYIISSIFLISNFSLFAQIDLVNYGSKTAIATNMINPAIPLDGELSFTFPGLSSIHFNSVTSFSPEDFVSTNSDGSNSIDIPLLLSNLKSENGATGFFEYIPLYISWHSKNQKGFISMGYSHIFDFKFQVSDDLISFLGKGNAAFIDQTVNFSDEQLGFLHYHKAYLNYSYLVNKKLRIGARINGYGGFNYFEVDNFSASVFTDGSSFPAYATTASLSFEGNSGGMMAPTIAENESYSFSGSKDILGLGFGLGIDLGFDYQINDNWSVAVAGRDLLSKISWKEDYSKKVTLQGDGQIEFTGFETSILSEDPGAEFEKQAEELEDELKSSFDFTTSNEKIKSVIGSSFTLGVGFKNQNEKHKVFGVVDGRNRFGDLDLQAGLVYHFSAFKFLQLSTSYSWMEAAPVNIGTGLNLKMGSALLHLSSNNIISYLSEKNLNQVSFRFGFNVVYPQKKFQSAVDILKTPSEELEEETNEQ